MENNALSNIEHVVVLMFENRSFDHILGGMPGVNGVLQPDGSPKPDVYNLAKPLEKPTEKPATANPKIFPKEINSEIEETDLIKHDFNHDFSDGMMSELFGPGTTGYVNGQPQNAPAKTWPENNCGFYSTTAWNVNSNTKNGQGSMSYFGFNKLNILHTLASSFVVCDNWFCDMPGCTAPNRAFIHCGTTGDLGISNSDSTTAGCNSETIFEQIESNGQSWRMYSNTGGQYDTIWLNQTVRNSQYTNRDISEFYQAANDGNLPFYSFLMCWSGGIIDTSMHPHSPIEPGENFLAEVYNTIRNSPSWQNTLLIVTFDENGGTFDHVAPPPATSPLNEGTIISQLNAAIPPALASFDFTLLGPRVPAILISPWLNPGIDSTQYQNTSITKFLQDQISPSQIGYPYLTPRINSATSVANAFTNFGCAAIRSDCPSALKLYDLSAMTKPGDPASMAPEPHMVNVVRTYLGGLPGHIDSGKPITRTFPTNASLKQYADQRIQAARWYDQGMQDRMSIAVIEKSPGQWIWQLTDQQGNILATPQDITYASKQDASNALDLTKFLMTESASPAAS